MHTFGETGAGVPAFLAKLWRLVDDPDTNNLICWSKDGRSFIIQNQAQFARELLPLNYKHNNMASFIRQLNMYGFHKITSIDNGGLKFDRDDMEFSHPCFKRNCPYLLEHIKRKIANTKTNDEKAIIKPEAVTKVLQDVKAMRGRQDSLDSRFSLMKQENEALWREIASLRQKHAKQQQIVNKLIQFLITIVQPSRNMTGVKRHMQLMINDTPDSDDFRKKSESESECGPVIHELGEELLDEVADADSDLMDPTSPYARNNSTNFGTESPSPLHMERPQSSISVSSQHYDYSNQSAEDALAPGQGNGAIPTQNQRNASPHTGSGGAVSPGSLIQTVNPDGSKVVYHVTEVLDVHPNDGEAANAAGQTTTYNEENVLTTPLVREQMARSQMLKQKNKQRRQKSGSVPSPSQGSQYRTVASKIMRLSPMPQQAQQPQSKQNDDSVNIKVEPNLDPMLFLNTYDDGRGLTPDPRLISPNLSEDSTQSGKYVNMSMLKSSPIPSSSGTNDSGVVQVPRNIISETVNNMYNAGDFITENMPNDLFDDSSLLSGTGDNSNFSETYKTNEQKCGQNTAKGGKFSSFVADNNANNANNGQNGNNGYGNGASISTAANRTAQNLSPLPSTSAAAATAVNNGRNANEKDDNNLAITKYNNEREGGRNQNIMRLSTADEVHGHLDNVQDELESLKELLRSDGYSLDASTLTSNGQMGRSTNNGFYAVNTDFIKKPDRTAVQTNCNDAQPSQDLGFLNKLLQNEAAAGNNNAQQVLELGLLSKLLQNEAAAGNNNAQQVLELGLLSKLFNDSDILSPFGLSMYSDLPNNSNQTKGSELMTYQPVYDLSDILDKSDLEAETDTMNAPSTSRQLPTVNQNSSVLNTPYHE